jgi:hypothetical protein
MFYFVRYVSSVAEGGAIFCKWAEKEVRTPVGHKKAWWSPLCRANILHPRSQMRAKGTRQVSGLRGWRAAVDFGLLFTKFSSGRTFTSNSQVANEFR